MTRHSFVADANFESAVGLDATRVVSCNTTSIVRVLGLLERHELLDRGRGTLLRRATDPWGGAEPDGTSSMGRTNAALGIEELASRAGA